MGVKTSNLFRRALDLTIETNGEVIMLRNGKTDDFHVISPDADSERMRMAGALGEMLYEQVKKAFGVNSLFIVAQNEDFKLVMFPRRDAFIVWKTNLDFSRIISAVGSEKRESLRLVRK